MRKLSWVVCAAALLPWTATAKDLEPGVLQLSGSTSLSWSSDRTEVTGQEDVTSDTFEIAGDATFYALRNLGVGLIVAFERESAERAGVSSEQTTTIIGPLVQYNLSLSHEASLFVGGAIGYASLDGDTNDASGFAWTVQGGLRYHVVPAVSLDASLGYTRLTLEDDFDRDIESGGVGVGVGISVYFGVR